MPNGMPWLSHSRWTFVPKPPWERPNAWFAGSSSCAAGGPPSRRGESAFFFCPGRCAAGPDDGGVHTPQVATQVAVPVEVVQEFGKDGGPGAVLAPLVEAVVDGLPGAVAFGDVAPGSAGVQDPQDAVEGAVVRQPGVALTAVVRAVGQQRGEALPLARGKFVTPSHGWPPLGNLPAGQTGLRVL